MNHAKVLTLFTLFIFQVGLFAQSDIRGVVTDAQTGEVIPYTNIYFKNHPVGVTAFRDGSFVLRLDTVYRDSLMVSCIGYEPQTLFLPNLVKTKFITVKLKPAQEQLAEVQVIPRKLKSYEAGLVKRKGWFSLGATADKPYARYIDNKYQAFGFIKTVSVYVTKKGIPTAPFRINLLAVDKVTGAPGEPLLIKDFIVQAEGGNQWVTIDLGKELITFPKSGFFVSVQALPLDAQQLAAYAALLPDIKPSLIKWYAPSFGRASEPFESAAKYNWHYGWLEERVWTPYWRHLYEIKDTTRSTFQNSSASSLMIKAEISYYADQKLKVKDFKSKRKVKRVVDLPKKNELVYPQSSPKDLLESVIKAVNKDEVGYLCAYLLYFDDEEELMSTLEIIEAEKARSDSVIISSKEKVEIRKVLTGIEMELGKLKPAAGERFLYQLNHDGGTFYFQNKDGIWRMSPTRTQIFRPEEELSIPQKF